MFRSWPALALAALVLVGCGGDGGPTPPDGPGDVPELVDLAVGELSVREADDEGVSVRLPGAAGGAGYVVLVQDTSRTRGFTPLRLSVRGGSGAAGAGAARPSRGPRLPAGLEVPSPRGRLGGESLSRRIRQNALRVLARRDARPARPSASEPDRDVRRRSLLPSGEVPETGDTLRVRLGVAPDLSVTCVISESRTITAVVEAVGREVALLADTLIADEASAAMEWSDLADEYDRSVLEVPEAYFGQVTDIDDNGRVLVLFTPEVNRLTERGADVFIGGFFSPLDLADSGDPDKDGSPVDFTSSETCPASNEAELVYLRAPDPEGRFSDSLSAESARERGLGASPGEFEHLINTGSRVIKQRGSFDQVETTWLDEGLSHVAEEVVGLARAGLPVRSNLDLADAVNTPQGVDAFLTFHADNFFRLRRFMINPDSTTVLATQDPGGVESLEMRGFAYVFLRWLGDHEGAAGSGAVDGSNEQQLFRRLARGSGQLATGIGNVEAATGEPWSELIRDFAAALAADDTIPTGPRLQVRTWDLPGLFGQLHEANEENPDVFPEPYPLEVRDLGSPAETRVSLSVQASAAGYFRVAASRRDTLTLRLTRPGGSALEPGASARLLVLRAD